MDARASSSEVELAYAGIARQAELIAAGEVSSRELVELYLERIGRLDGRLNAFRVVLAEKALLEADQADARRAAAAGAGSTGAGADGGAGRPLLGVPIAVKDNIDVAGELTCDGTNAEDEPARADAEVVRRLRAAGAVIIGKTNVPELCLWPFTETATFGVTRNPWDTQRTPGGSSGGSAAAVAAGLVGAALASDGAGSIRIPAAWCGLFGLKPQRGRVPLAPHPRQWHGMSVTGVLTRRVADTALFHDAVSGPPSGVDIDHAPPPSTSFAAAAAAPAGKLRIAYSTRVPPGIIASPDADARRALEDTVTLLRSLGHEVTERDPGYGTDAGWNVVVRYLRGGHDDATAVTHPGRLERRTRAIARLGGLIPASLLERSLAGEAALAARVNDVLDHHHVLLTPANAVPPPPIGRLQGRGAIITLNTVIGWVPYYGVWNLTGQPAACAPTAPGSDGLPRAVQLVGRPGEETTLLSLAAQLEAERPWADRRPPGFA